MGGIYFGSDVTIPVIFPHPPSPYRHHHLHFTNTCSPTQKTGKYFSLHYTFSLILFQFLYSFTFFLSLSLSLSLFSVGSFPLVEYILYFLVNDFLDFIPSLSSPSLATVHSHSILCSISCWFRMQTKMWERIFSKARE